MEESEREEVDLESGEGSLTCVASSISHVDFGTRPESRTVLEDEGKFVKSVKK